jgi:hypothetical protein
VEQTSSSDRTGVVVMGDDSGLSVDGPDSFVGVLLYVVMGPAIAGYAHVQQTEPFGSRSKSTRRSRN